MSDQENMRKEFIKTGMWPNEVMWRLWRKAWQASYTQSDAAHNEEIAAAQHCIEQMREALNAVMRLDYFREHGGLVNIIKNSLALQPSLSALYERDARVLEDAIVRLHNDNSLLTNSDYEAELQRMATERRNGKKGGRYE